MNAIPVTDSPLLNVPTSTRPDVPVAAGAKSPAGDATPQADIPFDDVLRAAVGDVLAVDASAVPGTDEGATADDNTDVDAPKTAAKLTDASPDTSASLTPQPLLPSALVSPAFVPPTLVPGMPAQTTPAGTAPTGSQAQVATVQTGQHGGDTLWPAAVLPQPGVVNPQTAAAATQPDGVSLQTAAANVPIPQATTSARGQARQAPIAALADTVPAMSTPHSAGTPSGAGDAPTAPRVAAALSALAQQGGIGNDTRSTSSADRAEIPALAMAAPAGLAEAAGARTGEASLRLPNGDATQWRQPLLQALGDRIQLTTQKGNESAVIRLEPPQMGSIEIAIRHQSGALQVNLSATHNDVLRQLQDISDTLRHDLGQRHSGDVSVQVTDATPSRMAQQGDAERQRQRQQQADERPGRALGDDESASKKTSFRLARNEE